MWASRLNDGCIMLVLREPEGTWVLYSFSPGRPAERVGTLPHTRAEFSLSNDGRHPAAFGFNDNNDIFMIRNLGSMLRRP
jgi:hypothetical protein